MSAPDGRPPDRDPASVPVPFAFRAIEAVGFAGLAATVGLGATVGAAGPPTNSPSAWYLAWTVAVGGLLFAFPLSTFAIFRSQRILPPSPDGPTDRRGRPVPRRLSHVRSRVALRGLVLQAASLFALLGLIVLATLVLSP